MKPQNATLVTETEAPKKREAREGDWSCVCGMYNFGFRSMCHKCSRLRPEEPVGADADGDAGAAAAAAASASAAIVGVASGASGSISVEASHFNAIVERVDALEAAVKALEDANAGITPGAGDGEGDGEVDGEGEGEGESEEELDAAAIVGDDTTADEESAPEEGGAGSGEVDANADTDAEIAETVEEDAADPNAAPK